MPVVSGQSAHFLSRGVSELAAMIKAQVTPKIKPVLNGVKFYEVGENCPGGS